MPEWTAESLLGLARGFMEPRLLLTGAELDVFTRLDRAALTGEELAAQIPADLRAVSILCDALCAMDLLVKDAGRYRCPAEVARFLSADSPATVLPMVLHAAVISQNWAKLPQKALGDGATSSSVGDRSGQLAAFIGAMHVVASRLAPQVAAAIGVGEAKRLIDIGGASGSYTIALLQASDALTATLFDRPDVVEMARERLTEAGLLARVTLAPGDFYTDELPGGHDLALLSAIIHQNSPEQNVSLYRKCLAALQPGGRLVVRDHVLSEDRTAPKAGALFAVNMLANTPGGNSYTFSDIRRDLEAAGFERVRLMQPDTQMDGLVEAFRPI